MLAAIVSTAPAAALPAATAAGSGLSTDNGTCAAPMSAEGACRLCGGAITPAFSTRVLGRYTVRYGLCGQCRSLQTETPYWLAEAYSRNLSSLDTGAAQRNLRNMFHRMQLTQQDVRTWWGMIVRLIEGPRDNPQTRKRIKQRKPETTPE